MRGVGRFNRDKRLILPSIALLLVIESNATITACYQWWYDPVWPYLYSNSLFYAIATMQVRLHTSTPIEPRQLNLFALLTIPHIQVLAGCILFFGVIGLAFLTLGPLLVASLVATLLYIPAYSMMQWLSTNIGTKFGYDGWSYGPSMGCGCPAI